MSDSNVKKYLEQLKSESKHDDDFIDALIVSDSENEDWSVTATKISEIINKRYVESKNNKT